MSVARKRVRPQKSAARQHCRAAAYWPGRAAFWGPNAMPLPSFSTYLMPIVLLTLSNVFMTFAWYGHLRFKAQPLLLVVVVSWLIAFFEYCLAVPANRYGNAV